MLQYYLYFSFIIILLGLIGTKSNHIQATKNGRPQYLFWVIFVLWLLIGLRDQLFGRDTLGYVNFFQKSLVLDLKDKPEPLHDLFVFLIRSITDNYHIYLLLSAAPICLALYYLFKRYLNNSYEVLAAICIYTVLGIFGFNNAGLRQTIAMSLGIFAFLYADKDKWIPSVLCLIIAYFYHNSSFILFLIYPAFFFNPKRYGPIIVIALFLIGAVMPGVVMPFIQTYLPMEDRFGNYAEFTQNQNYTGFFLQMILVAIAYIQKDKVMLPEKTKNFFMNMAFLGLGMQSLTVTFAEMFRVSYYFCIFDLVLVPLALTSFKGEQGKTIRVAFIIVCLIYIFIISQAATLPIKQDYTIYH